MRIVTFALVISVACCLAAPQNDVPEASQTESNIMAKLSAACANKKPYACTKLKLLVFTEKIWAKPLIQLSEDVVITRTTDQVFVSTPRVADDDFISVILGKARSFLQSRELHWKLIPETDLVISTGRDSNLNFKLSVDTARAAETARLKIKTLLPVAAAGIAKIVMIAALKFFGLIALVFKSLIVSKIALAAALFLFARLFQHQPAVTYEIVSQPHVSHTSSVVGGAGGDFGAASHSQFDSYSSSVGYGHGRSGVQADKLAYNAHVPK